MRTSDLVAKRILDLIEQSERHTAEIRRNELAEALGCVPSQINYVLSSRFTPEQGFIVESRRGGGGYIRITRVRVNRSTAVMHLISSIGAQLDRGVSRAMIENMYRGGILDEHTALLIDSALSDTALSNVPPERRGAVRADILKNMLLITTKF